MTVFAWTKGGRKARLGALAGDGGDVARRERDRASIATNARTPEVCVRDSADLLCPPERARIGRHGSVSVLGAVSGNLTGRVACALPSMSDFGE